MALLEIRDLTVDYLPRGRRVRAVDEVSLDVESGEYFGIVGESGCGKTTLARAILRLLPEIATISGGEIRYKSRDLARMSAKELRPLRWSEISFIPQSAMSAMDPVYRVGVQIIEAIRAHEDISREVAHQRCVELFHMVGLDPQRLEDYPHQFSGGMRQRALIAMALALNPDLIIADEPTTALDVIVKDRILFEMEKVQRQLKKSLLLVTHDISVVSENCDRVAVMYAGKVVEQGDTAGIMSAPFHPYTMGLRNAFPNLDESSQELISIPGAPPDLGDPPAGCRFHPRCPFAEARCRSEQPPLLEVGEGHFSACHFPERAGEFRDAAARPQTWAAKAPELAGVPATTPTLDEPSASGFPASRE